MSTDAPAPVSFNPVRRMAEDVLSERRAGPFPPGPTSFSVARTARLARDPLPLLLELYEQHGPVFTVRAMHSRIVFMLGPEANHYVLVGHPENFRWRDSSFGDLIPLLGDGLLTTDGPYHDRAREAVVPAFHREQIAAAVSTMVEEAEAALATWEAGETVEVYGWMRRLAMRIAMRALLGLDPDDHQSGAAAAEHFERALGFYGGDYHWRLLRGPGSPWQRMLRSRGVLDRIVFEEIARRRRNGAEPRLDILAMLLGASDEQGSAFSDRELRDQVMTLMFAGHDTSTSTLSFLLYELARHPAELDRVLAELDDVLAGAPPTPSQLERELPRLEMALDVTLRLYPAAWVGPRRAVRDFEFAGHRVGAGAYVNYCSWASHRLPEVFPDPDAFIPERFTREGKAALPRGAYVPFGGGSRICVGKRFGQIEIKAVAALALQRFRPEPAPGYELEVRQMPTLSPARGMPLVLHAR